jgi:diguanylate cyclase
MILSSIGLLRRALTDLAGLKELSLQVHRKKILILDDEEAFRTLLAGILENEGYSAHAMESKLEACNWVIANRPELIISDINSPGMNGFEFLRWMKANPVAANIPVMFVTGLSDPKTALEAKKLGAADCLFKSYDIVDLLSRIRELLGEE